MNSRRMEYLGAALRRERRLQDKTLQQVAEAVGLKENTISAYEKGKIQIPIDNLDAICKFLNTSYIDLLIKVQKMMDLDQQN